MDDDERCGLEQLKRGCRVSVRLAERATIVLHAADGLENRQIAQQMSISRQKVGRWRERYAQRGLAGIEKDAPRPGRRRRRASESTSGRIWREHGLKPHLVRTFKLSNDPQFVEKLEDGRD